MRLATDGDGFGNACDTDDDADGVLDVADNCPVSVNPDQADLDLDHIGNICDATPVPVDRYLCPTVDASPVTITLPGPKGPSKTQAKPTAF